MKRAVVYGSLVAVTAAMVATTIMGERERSGVSRRERYTKVGNAGDESAEATAKAEQFAQARLAPGVVLPGAYTRRSRRSRPAGRRGTRGPR